MREVSHGFFVGPNSVGSVVIIKPYSGAADLPHINAPLDIKRSVRTLFTFCLVFFKYLLPCIIGKSAIAESISFKSIGTPANTSFSMSIRVLASFAYSYKSVVMKFNFVLFSISDSIAVSKTSLTATSFFLINCARPMPS